MAQGYNGISNGESGSSIRGKLNKHMGEFTQPSPVLTIRFDDGKEDAYTAWKPALDSKNAVACSAIITDSVGTSTFMTWAQIIALENAGWEIVSHGKTGASLQDLTDEEIDTELEESLSALTAQGLNVKNYTPSGYGGLSIYGRQKARELYRSAGTGYTVGLKEGVCPQSIDLYNICGVRGDISGDYMADDPGGVAAVKALIDDAVANNGWLIYFLHGWTQDKEDGLMEIIDYAIASGVQIKTRDQALDIFEPYLFVGNSFGVNENAVMINRASGDAIWADENRVAIGINAGRYNDSNYNVFIGPTSGQTSSGTKKTAIGYESGYGSSSASSVEIGHQAGRSGTGVSVSFIGYRSGYNNTGNYAVGIGTDALYGNTGYAATSIGYNAGKNQSGHTGVFIGNTAGQTNSGAYCVGIGANACKDNTTDGVFELKQNSANSIPLIFGNFISQMIGHGVPASAPSDNSLSNNTMSFYLDEVGDTLEVKVKYSDGTVKTGTVANLT